MQRRTIRYQAAIVHDHLLLMLYVSDRETGRSFWCLPGGGREGEESEMACVRREVAEETGLDVEVVKLTFEETIRDDRLYAGAKTFLCRIIGGRPRPGLEPEVDTEDYQTIKAIGWFDLRDGSTWPQSAQQDPITHPLLQRIQMALGYLSVNPEGNPVSN